MRSWRRPFFALLNRKVQEIYREDDEVTRVKIAHFKHKIVVRWFSFRAVQTLWWYLSCFHINANCSQMKTCFPFGTCSSTLSNSYQECPKKSFRPLLCHLDTNINIGAISTSKFNAESFLITIASFAGKKVKGFRFLRSSVR